MWKLIVFLLVLGGEAAAGQAARVRAAKDVVVQSPDGRLQFVFRLTDNCPVYKVSFGGETIVDWSRLQLAFQEGGEFGRGLVVRGASLRKGEDDYVLAVGKASSVHDEYNEATIPMEERGGARRGVNLVVRVFNDGVGFRYVFVKGGETSAGHSATGFLLTDEHTEFRLAGDPFVTASFLPNYTSSHEGRYTRHPLSGIRSDTLMDMPVFVEFPHKIYMSITEAELVDYAGMYLARHNGILTSDLSPLPGQGSVKVKGDFPHQTPWRVLLIGDRPGALIESNIITSLNEPCAIKDLSWLRPGKTDFHWWNGDVVPDTNFQPGINFETNQYYIDFCARNKLDYHSVIGYGGIAWYRNDGVSYMPGPHSDVTEPLPGLDMQQICDYAKSKGVGIRVWVHWQVLYPELDKAFTQFEKWGISGMMVDFMNRDDQEMVNIQTEILQKAAQHHLHIQFHGAYKPTGLARTWPNEFTREGTLNYECDKWGDPITPDDDINIPFTRLLAGATDYHLGGFRAVTPLQYKAHFVHPQVLGTRCHMLAMYVVLESALGMVCDNPEAYEGQDGFEFIRDVPTTWDKTKVPLAVPGEYVSIARCKGGDWYVGTITNNQARTVSLPLDFLPPGQYEAVIYRDAEDASENPNHLIREVRAVAPSEKVEVKLASGGGMVMKIRKLMRGATAQRVMPLYYPDSIPNSIPHANEEERAKDEKGVELVSKISRPTLTLFLPVNRKGNLPAVVICPGGGYWVNAVNLEGYDEAKVLNSWGVAAFVLTYRIPDSAYCIHPEIAPLQDAQQAILQVRRHASEWHIDPGRVGIMGFSAGGHLASTAGTHFDKVLVPDPDNISVRPDWMILGYPVISGIIEHSGSFEKLLGKNASDSLVRYFSNETRVTDSTPPAFLVHAQDDDGVSPENSILFYRALTAHHILAELHLYEKGGHGFGLHLPMSEELWMDRCKHWMELNGWLR